MAVGRWVWRPTLVFGVYPGSRRYIDTLVIARWLEWLPFPDLCPIGLIRTEQGVGVLVATTRILTDAEPEVLFRTTRAFRQVFPWARSVSLSGRWQSVLVKQGHPMRAEPLVNGTLGTVYAMQQACEAMVRQAGLAPEDAHLCVLGGGGLVGRELIPRLAGRYRRLTAIDPCYANNPSDDADVGVIRTAYAGPLRTADAVLVLTPTGDDALPYADFAVAGQVWGDDCFPEMSARTQQAFRRRGVRLYKTSLSLDTLRFLPELPTFGRSNVPGCLVSSLVNEVDPGLSSWERFVSVADRLGLRPMLFPHQPDA